jgi:hypothetical protein
MRRFNTKLKRLSDLEDKPEKLSMGGGGGEKVRWGERERD